MKLEARNVKIRMGAKEMMSGWRDEETLVVLRRLEEIISAVTHRVKITRGPLRWSEENVLERGRGCGEGWSMVEARRVITKSIMGDRNQRGEVENTTKRRSGKRSFNIY